jgi:hypothetical protein
MKSVKFAGKALALGGEMLQDRKHKDGTTVRGSQGGKGTHADMAAAKKKCLTCEDCYFKQNMLCALNLDAPCPTYRPADRGLRPERQLAFVFRTERTRAAYAFPQPQGRW